MTSQQFQKGQIVRVKIRSNHYLLRDGSTCLVWGISPCGKSYTVIGRDPANGDALFVSCYPEQMTNAGALEVSKKIRDFFALMEKKVSALTAK